jgi:hypothetical protein
MCKNIVQCWRAGRDQFVGWFGRLGLQLTHDSKLHINSYVPEHLLHDIVEGLNCKFK